MFIPISTDSSVRRNPYMNWALILLNVLAYVAVRAFPQLKPFLTLYPNSPHWYSYFGYQFNHEGLLHIGGNMLFLYIFGNVVNEKMGHLGYLAFYLAGGVFAGTFYVLTAQNGAAVIGASGAISAVTGAYLILSPRSYVTIFWFFFFIGKFEIQSMWVILFYFVQDIWLTGGDDVAHMAHIGGTIFGATICVIFLAIHLLPRDQYDVWGLLTRWNKRRQYRDMVAKGFDPFDYSNKPASGANRRANDAVAEQVQDIRQRINAALGAREMAIAADLYTKMKALDNQQVLSRQAQLDIATQLHHDGRYPQAAEAYEALLKAYPKIEHVEQIELILGLMYARDLRQYSRARELLSRVIDRVHEGRVLEMAREELSAMPVV